MQQSHKVTTRNEQEALETGKLYLGKEFYKNINALGSMLKPSYRCLMCGGILKTNNDRFCSQFCKDDYLVEKVKMKKCTKCGEPILPRMRISKVKDKTYNVSAGTYRSLCSKCLEKKYPNRYKYNPDDEYPDLVLNNLHFA